MSESRFNLSTLIAAVLISVVLSVAISYSIISLKTGPPGSEGPQGEVGLTGPPGSEGPHGPQGEQGIQGIQGEEGPPGVSIVGPTGSKGDTGAMGFYSVYQPSDEYVEVPGILNGDFNEYDEHRATYWFTSGRSGITMEGDSPPARGLGQRVGGTYMSQTIVIKTNQGIAFSVKSTGARLEVHVDSFVLFYGDFRNSPEEWMTIVVPVGDIWIGVRTLYFVVLGGLEGPGVTLDNVTLVEFI